MNTDQIVAEATGQVCRKRGKLIYSEVEAIIKSAIEKATAEATKNIADFAAEVVNAKKDPIVICRNCGVIQHDQIDRICTTCQRRELRTLSELHSDYHTAVHTAHRASHASEPEAHKDAMEYWELVWFATLVEPYVSNQYCHKKDDLSRKLYDACVKIRAITDKYSKNIPTNPSRAVHASEKWYPECQVCGRPAEPESVAHASEHGAWTKRLADIVTSLRKSYGNRYCQGFNDALDAVLDAALSQRPTPATASEQRAICKHCWRFVPESNCPICGREPTRLPQRPIPATEQATHDDAMGGEWTVSRELYTATLRDSNFTELLRLSLTQDVDLQRIADAHNAALRDKQKECDDMMDAHEIKLAAEYATLRDCGNDSKRLERLLKAVYEMKWPLCRSEDHALKVAAEIEGERIAERAIDAAMLKTGEQTKEKE